MAGFGEAMAAPTKNGTTANISDETAATDGASKLAPANVTQLLPPAANASGSKMAQADKEARAPSPSPPYQPTPAPAANDFPPTYQQPSHTTPARRALKYITDNPKPSRGDILVRVIALCVEGIGMILYTVALTKDEDVQGDFNMTPFNIIALGSLSFGFIVSLCYAVAVYAYKSRPIPPIPPGCSVGWDLICWMLLITIAIMLSIFGIYAEARAVEVSGVGIMWLATFIHFAIFVEACRRTDRLRLARMMAKRDMEEGRQRDFELAARTPGTEIERE